MLWRIDLQSRKPQDVTKSSYLTVSQCHVLFAQVASLGHLEPLLHEALRQGPELFCSDYLHSRHALGESMKPKKIQANLGVRFWPGQFGTEYQRAIALNCNSCQGGSCMAWPSSWSNSAKAPRAMMPLAAFFGSPGPSKGSIKSCWKLKCHGFQVWTMDGTKPFSAQAIYTFINHQLYIH